MAYAQNTTVSVEKSEAEIRRLLMKYGARQFSSGWDETSAHVTFTLSDRQVRFVLQLPQRNERRFTHGARGARSREEAFKQWEQGCRQSWRALVLIIKAKLEAVESKITTFEHEFLAHLVLPGGRTIGEYVVPNLNALTSGRTKLLPQPQQAETRDAMDAEVVPE